MPPRVRPSASIASGKTPGKRRLTTLKTLCMLLLDTDVHDVHVIHDSRYTNLFGMQRDIIFT